jgi:phosphate transport system substrate-binding protein
MRTFSRRAAVLVAASFLAAACGGGNGVTAGPTATDSDPQPADQTSTGGDAEDGGTDGDAPAGSLVGAGATFVNPIFVDWILDGYQAQVNPDADINYQSIGSGGGIEQFLLQTVDFGASERYLYITGRFG